MASDRTRTTKGATSTKLDHDEPVEPLEKAEKLCQSSYLTLPDFDGVVSNDVEVLYNLVKELPNGGCAAKDDSENVRNRKQGVNTSYLRLRMSRLKRLPPNRPRIGRRLQSK